MEGIEKREGKEWYVDDVRKEKIREGRVDREMEEVK